MSSSYSFRSTTKALSSTTIGSSIRDGDFEDEFQPLNKEEEEEEIIFYKEKKVAEEEEFRRSVEDPLERDAKDAIRERILFRKCMVSLPALATIGVNIVAILTTLAATPAEGTTIVFVLVASSIAVFMSLWIFVTEIFIVDDIGSMVEVDQRQALLLQTNRSRLISKQKQLQLNVFCLKEDERRLIAEMNDPHKGRKYLKGVVKKYKKQMIEKTEAYRQYVITDVMNLVIRADKDESGEFDDREIKHLIRYIKALPTVQVNEKKLSKAIKKERSLYSVLSLVQDLSKKDVPSKKRIFTFDEQKIELQVIAMSKQYEQKASKASTARTSGTTKTSVQRGRSVTRRDGNDDHNEASSIKKNKAGKKKSITTKKKKKKKSTSGSRSFSPAGGSKFRESKIDFNHPMTDNLLRDSKASATGNSKERKGGRSRSPALSGKGEKSGTSGGLKKVKSRSLSPTPSAARGGRSVSPGVKAGFKTLSKGISPFLGRKKKDTTDVGGGSHKEARSGFF